MATANKTETSRTRLYNGGQVSHPAHRACVLLIRVGLRFSILCRIESGRSSMLVRVNWKFTLSG